MTKYYKLLKDLPTFKKGDLFRLSDEGNLSLEKSDFNPQKSQVLVYDHYTLEHFPNILKDWFEEVEGPNGRWKPKEGDKYYYIRSYGYDGAVIRSRWTNDYFNRVGNEIGNVFRTKEEAEKAVEWLKARKVLFDDAKGFKPDWRDTEQRKWSVCYDCVEDEDEERLYSAFNSVVNDTPGPYFATKGDADLSIIEHRKEWLTYLLGSGSND